MKILLIAGHGEGDSGAVSGNFREDKLTREFVTLLQKELLKKSCACAVYNMSLSAYHRFITLGNNYDFTPYDYVLEVHFNSCNGLKNDGATTGSEIFVTSDTKATDIEARMLKNLEKLGFRNRGVKRKNMDLIRKIKSSGVSCGLLEVCFINDPDDMKLYTEKKEQVVSAVAEGFNLPEKEKSAFSDVENHWAKNHIEAVAKAGIMCGYSDGTFKPEKAVTRAEIAVIANKLKG